MEEINICFTFDDNYAKYCATAMASILVNRKDNYKINFYLITDSIKEESKQKLLKFQEQYKDITINFKIINIDDFSFADKISTSPHITKSGFYRLFLPDLLINIDKVLYLDCDLLIRRDIKEIYQNNIENYSVAGVADRLEELCANLRNYDFKKYPYFNSGVLLFNLKIMREKNTINDFLVYAEENKNNIQFGDQDIINGVLHKDTLKISTKYNNYRKSKIKNYKIFLDTYNNRIITHYTGSEKPWFPYINPLKQWEFLKYLKYSNFSYSKSYCLKSLYMGLISLIFKKYKIEKNNGYIVLKYKFFKLKIKEIN